MSYLPPLYRVRLGFVAGMLLFSLLFSHVAANRPKIKFFSTTFTSQPSHLFYFKNSSVIIFLEAKEPPVIWRSEDEGKTWENKTSPVDNLKELYQHPFDDQKAIALTGNLTHYVTLDRGKSWHPFKTPVPVSFANDPPVIFHASKPEYVLFHGINSTKGIQGSDLKAKVYYTKSFFSTTPTLVIEDVQTCLWGKGNKEISGVEEDSIFCTKSNSPTTSVKDKLKSLQLVSSSDFTNFTPVDFDKDNEVDGGVIGLSIKEGFLIAGVLFKSASNDTSLFISTDGKKWAKAEIPMQFLTAERYALLESTPYSLVLSVKHAETEAYNSLYFSDSDGVHFSSHLSYVNRDSVNSVDVERMSEALNLFVANVVSNYKDFANNGGAKVDKKLQTRISFNNGLEWSPLPRPNKDCNGKPYSCPDSKSCSLHLGSVTNNLGHDKVLSRPAAPGLLVGMGNVGDALLPKDDWDVFLSQDGGKAWHCTHESPHEFAVADRGALLVLGQSSADHLRYSFDQGGTWIKYPLSMSLTQIKLMTEASGGTNTVLLSGKESEGSYVFISIDFTDSLPACQEKDFELWTVPGTCFMGLKHIYKRRKPDALCLVGSSFNESVSTSPCNCAKEDYECNSGYTKKGGSCVADGSPIECGKEGQTSPYRRIPGNGCTGGTDMVKAHMQLCPKAASEHTIGKIQSAEHATTTQVVGAFSFRTTNTYLTWGRDGKVYSTYDGGLNWTSSPVEGGVHQIVAHDFNSSRAYILTKKRKMFLALNSTQTLHEITLPQYPIDGQPLHFHPTLHDHLLLLAQGDDYVGAYISTNNGGSWSTETKYVEGCRFAETIEFSPSDDHALCLQSLTKDKQSPKSLIKLDTKSGATKILEDVVHFELAGKFLLAGLKEEHKLVVSVTDYKFTPVQLPLGSRPRGQFILHTSPSAQSDSVFLSIELEPAAEGELPTWGLYVSNSDGNQFSLSLPGIDVIPGNMPDLELVQGIDGIVVGNQLLVTDQDKHLVKSSISYDYGSTWNHIPIAEACDGCSLHLHVMPEPGRWWGGLSGQDAAGRILAVGSIGRHREMYEDSQTYASTDSGVTWTEVWPSESLYALGNYGNLMVLVDDEAPTDSLRYSTDGGKSWVSYKFASEIVRATHLLAKEDGSSLQFVIVGLVQSNTGPQSVLYGVNFRTLYPDNCEKNDLEPWSFQGPPPLNSKCILGQELSQQRVKANSSCFLDSPPKLTSAPTSCECTALDFECDFGFYRSNHKQGECIRVGRDPDRPPSCPPGTNYTGASGYRRIPASQCTKGIDLTLKVNRTCHEVDGFVMRQKIFEADVNTHFYFKASTKLLLHTKDSKVWISKNEGFDFEQFLTDISQMIHHSYIDNSAYFLTKNNTLHFTHNEGDVLASYPAPGPPNNFGMPVLNFHPKQKTWAIYISQKNCDSLYDTSCHGVAYLTKNSGKNWTKLATNVNTCSFTHSLHFVQGDSNGVFCQFLTDKATSSMLLFTNSSLVYSADEFATNHTSVASLIKYDTFYEFMIATESKPPQARLLVSKDGMDFSPVRYPPGTQVIPGLLTVADSDTHSLIVHFTTSVKRGGEMGALMKSDSNGTNFVLSLDNVNRDINGNMDFEKMAGIEGIALANQVSNPQGVLGNDPKKLVTQITFDNGASWSQLLTSPGCTDDSCKLHLLSYTERSDPENIFSIPAAVGMMVGVGNTGESLHTYLPKQVYFTDDAGKSWSKIQDDPHRHEFGDSGGIILLVPESKLTDKVLYSLDMGLSFDKLSLEPGMEAFTVRETATEPQSTSQKMLILGYTKDHKFTTVFIDFSNVHERKCKLEDFEKWTPSFSNDTCFFGHKTEYSRRKRQAKCYIGNAFKQPNQTITHCPCTREDFECDFNFELNNQGECQLIKGLEPLETSCNNGEGFYSISSGYRLSPFTTCQGGVNLAAENIPCSGPGLSGLSLFFIIMIPLSCLGFLLYAVVRRGYRRPIPWEYLFQSLIPCLCFIPAMLVNCLDGPGSAFLGRLRGTFNRGQGYEPVPQYDYDLDEDYIDGPVEVQLEDYDIDQTE